MYCFIRLLNLDSNINQESEINNGTHINAYIITNIFHKFVWGVISQNHIVAIVVIVKYRESINLNHSIFQNKNHHKSIIKTTSIISRNSTFLKNNFQADFIFIFYINPPPHFIRHLLYKGGHFRRYLILTENLKKANFHKRERGRINRPCLLIS